MHEPLSGCGSAVVIDLDAVLKGTPPFPRLPSVDELHALANELALDPRFAVTVVGRSAEGRPIHHVRHGMGPLKAMLVGFPHCMEPIGGATVTALLRLLQAGEPGLVDAPIEWHVVPCIDPDGAVLNEGWTQTPFDLRRHLRNYFLQAYGDQVDGSFPVAHKKLIWDRPSPEAAVLRALIDAVRPDLYVSLHNTKVGGAFFMLNRDLGRDVYAGFEDLLRQCGLPLQSRPPGHEICRAYSTGVLEIATLRRVYDRLEGVCDQPQALMPIGGASSWEYAAEANPRALTFLAEVGYADHPFVESDRPYEDTYRRFKLRLDAAVKYVAAVVREEWAAVEPQVDRGSVFYRALARGDVLPTEERIVEGGWPLARYTTRETLFSPGYGRPMTEADLFHAAMGTGGLWSVFPQWTYQFLRLLRASPPHPDLERAIARLEGAFDELVDEVGRALPLDAFTAFDCTALAKAQLGSVVIVANRVLVERTDGHG